MDDITLMCEDASSADMTGHVAETARPAQHLSLLEP